MIAVSFKRILNEFSFLFVITLDAIQKENNQKSTQITTGKTIKIPKDTVSLKSVSNAKMASSTSSSVTFKWTKSISSDVQYYKIFSKPKQRIHYI